MTTQQQPRLKGQPVLDRTGQRIGDVQRVFYDEVTNQAAWITIRGLGAREAFVPLAGARIDPSGVTVALRKDAIEGAPAISAGNELKAADAGQLDRYYAGRLSLAPQAPPAGGPQPTPTPTTEAAKPTELTSYEERLRVGTETKESGNVRLRKYVEAEPVETSVPVRHEEVRVERVPEASPKPMPHRFEEESAEVTLHEEQPITTKETVPVETVRLVPDSETEEQRVSDEVRREHIEVEDKRPGARRR